MVKDAADSVIGRCKFSEYRTEQGTDRIAVAIDTSTKASAPKPTVSIDDVDKASRAEGQAPGGDSVPGAIPADAAPPVPTWVSLVLSSQPDTDKTAANRLEADC